MKLYKFIKMYSQRKNREKIYNTAEYWNLKANEYEDHSISMWPNNYLNYFYHNEQVSLIDRYLLPLKGARVLDVGCGTGRISRYLATRDAKVLGVDFSADAIAIAQKQTKNGNPSYRVQSIFDLEYNGDFDIVISWGVLTVATVNREELAEIMKRLKRALKPCGKALFLEPIHSGFLHRVLNMNLREFCSVMDETGFKVAEVKELHFWPARLFLCYLNWPRFITAAVYHLGEFMMQNLGLENMGDYKAIIAINGQEKPDLDEIAARLPDGR